VGVVLEMMEILFNMFDKSKKTAALVGSCPCFSLLVIYFSIPSCIALMMVTPPLGIPTAKLYGSRYSANLDLKVCATCRAMICRMAVGIPIGRS